MATRPTHASKQGTEANARPKSTEIFERGKKILVGGVDSPVRAFRAVGGTPLVIERAEGARLYDVDGREYIDYVCSWGALILGHAHPDVVRAVAEQAKLGTSYGMTSPLEIELAEQIAKALPSIREDAVRQFGDGSDHERGPVGARIYEAGFDFEIRGRVSRAFGQFSGGGWIGTGDAGNFVEPGSAGGAGEADVECAV